MTNFYATRRFRKSYQKGVKVTSILEPHEILSTEKERTKVVVCIVERVHKSSEWNDRCEVDGSKYRWAVSIGQSKCPGNTPTTLLFLQFGLLRVK